MKAFKRVQTIGIMLGTALLFSGSSRICGAAARSGDGQRGSPPELTDAVTAPARDLSRAFAAVAGHVRPAVVSVFSEKIVKFRGTEGPFPFGDDFLEQFFGQGTRRPMPQEREYRIPQHGMGSGMILDKKGHILTNHHVVDDVDAEVVGQDPRSDVAVIRIKGSVPDDLATIGMGDSDALVPGDLVMAIGAPFGLAQTVTTGIISAKGRNNVGIADFEDFLQTDAPINPGNSGGPLVNMRGEVVGMNTAMATSVGQFSGVSFAIPMSIVKSVLPVLMKGETVQRGLLGVVIQDVTKELAKQFQLPNDEGALVSQVSADSAAEKAGIKIGDVITRYSGKHVADSAALRNMVATTQPGAKAEIGFMRSGKEQTVSATIGTLTSAKAGASPGAGGEFLSKFGLAVRPRTPQLAKQLGYENPEGVLIAGVEDGSPAAAAGVQDGDLITAVNREKVASMADVDAVVAKAEDRNSVLLLINRKGASLFVVLQAP